MNRHDIFWKTAVRIRDTYRDHIKGEEAYAYAEDAARELQDAGLLAPDLPAPLTAANGNPVWRADGTLMVTRYPDGEIRMLLDTGQEARYTPETAREQAALLLAAAKEETEAHHER